MQNLRESEKNSLTQLNVCNKVLYNLFTIIPLHFVGLLKLHKLAY